jgi:outer membrane lipoprotein-sorting protein
VVFLSLALMLLLATVGRASGPSAAEVMARARRAVDAYSYHGVRRVEARSGSQTLVLRQRVYHAPGGRERFEILQPPSMAGNLAILDGRTHWRYYPARHQAYKSRATLHGSDPLAASLFAPAGRSRLALVGTATVAGHPCHVLGVSGQDGKRRLTAYVDESRYVLLGVDRRGPDGSLVDSWRFETIQFVKSFRGSLFVFRPPADTRVVSERTEATRVGLAEAARRLGIQPLLPRKLPDSFRLLEDRVTIVRRGKHEALWMPFSNGVETFSIFQSRTLPRNAQPPAHSVRWDVGAYTLLIVGHLEASELAVIKASLP